MTLPPSEGPVAEYEHNFKAFRDFTQTCRWPDDIKEISYGNHSREKIDVYWGALESPVLFFIHGGAWVKGDKKNYSFMKVSFPDTTVVIPNYIRLVDDGATWEELLRSIEAAYQWTMDNVSDNIVLCGHSAGAHLAAYLASKYGCRGAVCVSGLYDLPKLFNSYPTTYYPEAAWPELGEVVYSSPAYMKPPDCDKLILVRGEAEIHMRDHMRALRAYWSDVPGEDIVVRQADHWTVMQSVYNYDGLAHLALKDMLT